MRFWLSPGWTWENEKRRWDSRGCNGGGDAHFPFEHCWREWRRDKKTHFAVSQADKTTVSDKPSEPSRTPAESYSRFSGEQLCCNFSQPFSSKQSSSLPLVMVKMMVKVMVTVRSWKVLVSCWKMGHLSLKCLSLKCFTPTPKNTPHLMLISSQYWHTRLDLEHFSIFCSTPASLVFVFRLVTSSVLGTLGAP